MRGALARIAVMVALWQLASIALAVPVAQAQAPQAQTPAQAQAPQAQARGSRPSQRVRFSWVRGDDAAGCADQTAMERALRGMFSGEVFALEAARSVEAIVARTEHGYSARLFVRDRQGAPLGERTIESQSPDCGSLSAAAAIAIALLIDPEATTDAPEFGAPALPEAPPAREPAPPPRALPAQPAPLTSPRDGPPLDALPLRAATSPCVRCSRVVSCLARLSACRSEPPSV